MDDNQIRILFLSANPRKDKPLDLQGEYGDIDEALGETKLCEQVALYPRWKVTNAQLLDHFLRYRPHIIHFSGHGTDGSLVLDDGEGHEWSLDRSAARAAFKTTASVTRLVVLNACMSADVGQVVSEVIDCVIGMSQDVFDETSIAFSSALYAGLGDGLSVRDAFDRARTQITMLGRVGSRTPILISKPGVDPRRMFLKDWISGKPELSAKPEPPVKSEPPARPEPSTEPQVMLPPLDSDRMDRRTLRGLLGDVLKLDADFDAFVLDHFPDVYRRYSGGMDRIQKMNLLLSLKEPADIHWALRRYTSLGETAGRGVA